PVAVLVTDRAGIIEYVNPRFQTLTGWTEDDVLGRTPGILKSGYTPPESYEALWRSITAGEEWRGEFLNRTRDGDLFWAAATIAPVRDEEGRITHFVAVEEDVTMRKLYEERLFRQANYDELTGLPNRTLLADRLVEALRAKRADVAVLAVDLDDFKRINESLGHGAGDAILREASARLVEAVGPSGVVARLGDDDYAVLLPGIEGPDAAGTIAGLVIEAFRRPYKAGQGEAVVTASVGVAVAPGDGDEANRLLGSATMAMVMAKKQGGDRFRFFSADMEKRARRRFEVESQLRRALARGELELALQPIYSIADRRMAGVEALIRWDSPVLGRVPPEGFIPLAETSGLIEPIGAWVLEEACRQVAHLCDAGHDLFVAVNVSPAQFGSGTLPQAIETALTKSGLPPRSLEIEITESLLLVETPALAGIMAELTRLGVRLSLDDFGTGYSSLAYLRRWPFETLKIDRSFVSDVIASRDAAVLVEAVIAMAHRLNLRVVAEGVETRAQLDFLADRRCDLAQGHLLGRPGDWRSVLAALDGEAFSP
ncbi:MAG: EAL domain-containing protein, partial [Alphaproteobacteria bacterium]|nr:EAL domain-containing protein [Alphaproteobacteria bacterium]